MTVATKEFIILDQTMDVDTLVDIVNHGMSGGVSGFIYNNELLEIFNEHEEEIMSFLNCYCDDQFGVSVINYLSSHKDYDDIQGLTNDLVWMYVEAKAHDELMLIEHPSVY